MFKLADATVYNDLSERLATITPAQIEGAARKLKKEETDAKDVIGVITSESTRALFTLWRLLGQEESLELALANGATDEIAEKDHQQKAALLDMFGDAARELFWAQAKIDVGFYERSSVGLRQDWRLVKEKGPAGLNDILAAMRPI